MARHENTTPAIEDALNASQVLFTANPLFLPPQSKHLFQAQERFWDEIETFSTAWFRRRQAATHAIIDAGRRIASEGGRDPALMIKEVTELQSGAMERLTADARECTEMLTHCADALARNEITAIQETAEKTQRATKTAKSDPV
ncbi:hypothetical protein [Roseovarius sp. M141]|uniref:hypothetical protein n=1 Tax=Roseovarius sp. M141 TaxID=2583806 RepID=UPI0020CD2EA6|nr:hypothetical protein [Roseovarius sp. M141]MCQ0091706.1 hypothetical protein [Roseovarius sp. M141]